MLIRIIQRQSINKHDGSTALAHLKRKKKEKDENSRFLVKMLLLIDSLDTTFIV
jgi:hypothetical protein